MTLDDLWNFWPHLLAVISVALAVPASLHCVLHKRDTRAATAWVGLIWLTPLLGTLLYILLGINRIAHCAGGCAANRRPRCAARPRRHALPSASTKCSPLPTFIFARWSAWSIARPGIPLVDGNRIEPLVNGESAYPAMLAAIDAAQRSVALSTYLFNHDDQGLKFVEALAGR